LQLPEVLDMNAAAPLAGELVTYRGNDLQADASQVQRIGGQGVQVLLSALATWQHDGFKFSVVQPSAVFKDVIEVLGINHGELLGRE
jgi:chemotaxis protein CheX